VNQQITQAASFVLVVGMLSGCAVSKNPATTEPGSLNDETSQTSESQTLERAPIITLDNLDPQFVRSVAFEETQKRFTSISPIRDRAKHFLTPGVNEEFVNLAREKIPMMAAFYEDVAVVEDFTFFWANENEGKALAKLLCSEANYCENLKPADYCGVGLYIDLYVNCHPGSYNRDLLVMYILHGYTHAVQNEVSLEHMPSWFSEGTADYFGYHFNIWHYSLGFSDFGPHPDSIQNMYEGQNLVEFEANPTPRNIVDAFMVTETRFPADGGYEQAQLGYYLGSIAVEALVATFGLAKFNEFWRSTKSLDFYVAFEQAFGLSTKQFYKKLAPYAVEMIKLDRKNP
jgi:hypothetical protein